MRRPSSTPSDAARADAEVVYVFYPGTGKRDLLEYNIVNAPILPKWRERKPAAAKSSRHTPQDSVKQKHHVRAHALCLACVFACWFWCLFVLQQSGRLAFRRIVSEKLYVRRKPLVFGYCDNSVREKDWRGRKRQREPARAISPEWLVRGSASPLSACPRFAFVC
jgi:hypothetical protein